jgi:hypothetical protein
MELTHRELTHIEHWAWLLLLDHLTPAFPVLDPDHHQHLRDLPRRKHQLTQVVMVERL